LTNILEQYFIKDLLNIILGYCQSIEMVRYNGGVFEVYDDGIEMDIKEMRNNKN
jgi:hypothetical protein